MSSASRNATYSPCEARTLSLRATVGPPLTRSSTVTRLRYASSALDVASVDPSLTTITSRSPPNFCASAPSSAAAIVASPLNTGIIAETVFRDAVMSVQAPGPHVQLKTTVPCPISRVLSSLTIMTFPGGQVPSAIGPVHGMVIMPGTLPLGTVVPQVVKLLAFPMVTPRAPVVIAHPTTSVTLPEQVL